MLWWFPSTSMLAGIFYHFISDDDKKLHVAPFRCKLTINFNYLQGHIVSFKLHLIKLNLRSFFLHTLQNCLSMSSIKIAIFWITALLYHQIKNIKKKTSPELQQETFAILLSVHEAFSVPWQPKNRTGGHSLTAPCAARSIYNAAFICKYHAARM